VLLLIEEATRRSGVVWVTAEGSARAHPVWQLWHDGAMYVVTGGLEQPLTVTGRATVTVRSKDRQADRLVTWVADVAPVPPDSAQWAEVVPLLHAKRLNAPDGDEQPRRWARESVVLRFTPTGETVPIAPDSYAAAPAGPPHTAKSVAPPEG
jgi:hypothetical protein